MIRVIYDGLVVDIEKANSSKGLLDRNYFLKHTNKNLTVEELKCLTENDLRRARDELIGKKLAEVLGLKVNDGRIQTQWGSKS